MANIPLKGIRLFPKKDSQPDFVIASGVLTPDDLNAFLIDNKEHESEYQGQKQFRIQVLKGKDANGPYIVLDTYKAAAAPTQGPQVAPELPEEDPQLPF
jgi:hypothetical protein